MFYKNKKAFTLVELIVVITILSIISTFSIIFLMGNTNEAIKKKLIYNINHLNIRKQETILELYNTNMSDKEKSILKKDNELNSLLCKKLNTIIDEPDNKYYIIKYNIYKKIKQILYRKELSCSKEIEGKLQKFSDNKNSLITNNNNYLKNYVKEAKISKKKIAIDQCLTDINKHKKEYIYNGKIDIKGIQLIYLNCINKNIDFNTYKENLIYDITENIFKVENIE